MKLFKKIFEGLNAEVEQLIASIKVVRFLKTMQDMASGYPSTEYPMPCLASFFDAMSGVKNLTNLYPAFNCKTLANEASFIEA